ncbi:MAG: Hsp70 family protein [Planctomycetes bacterium]|nr:Hsp70 family protein [Planctomycetota bacterium]
MKAPDGAGAGARYVVGIDLGTTNSAAAYVDTAARGWKVRDLAVPQLVGPGEVEARDTLPSCHYEAAPGEFPAGALRLPWSTADARHAVGFFARDHGAAVPGRLIASAKSWLCHPGVNRTAPLLPWRGAPDVERLSPVTAAARYLGHLRAAWNHAFPDHPLETQDVVLTVPASFDEVARELTAEAAVAAGLPRIVLIEEPQAAFYAWLAGLGAAWRRRVRPGQRILVCDVGGGTTDFTLIQAEPGEDGAIALRRIAVGEHLILGGDNLDLALAHHLEERTAGAGKLDPSAWGRLVRACRQVKETLLGDKAPKELTVNVAGGGARLVGGGVQVQVTRAEGEALVLDGFLPRVGLDARPATRRSGFQEFALPYAPDPAITKYLAAFLAAHRQAAGAAAGLEGAAREGEGEDEGGDAGVPEIVLLNGGFFASPVLRDRLLEVLSSWREAGAGGKRAAMRTLRNDRLDLAVARGAAYYGTVRRGRGVRISGGLLHSYYVGVDAGGAAGRVAVCLLPSGLEEGQGVDLTDRAMDLLIRRPVEFPLYVSRTEATDAPGELVGVDDERMAPLPPIRTVIGSGRGGAADLVRVHLHARRTEIGTLDLWLSEARGDRKWRLSFDLRARVVAQSPPPSPSPAEAEAEAEAEAVAAPAAGAGAGQAAATGIGRSPDPRTEDACAALIRATFRPGGGAAGKFSPDELVKCLERLTESGRHSWAPARLRGFWEVLLEVADGRHLGVPHEARWLSLTGFSLRPGFGLAIDDWRVAQTWKLFGSRVTHRQNELCRAEWWILWRRIAGGLAEGQQHALAEPLLATWREHLRPAGGGGGGGGKAGGAGGGARAGRPATPVAAAGRGPALPFGPHEGSEVWRLLGSLELLGSQVKAEMGELLFQFFKSTARPPAASPVAQAGAAAAGCGVPSGGGGGSVMRDAALWALGRLGARVPAYGSLDAQVAPEAAESWARRLLELDPPEKMAPFALVHLTRRTHDRYRDVTDSLRDAAVSWLERRGAPARSIELVREGAILQAEEQGLVLGESLPPGLRIEMEE